MNRRPAVLPLAAIAAAAVLSFPAAAATPGPPPTLGSKGERVCDAMWLLRGHNPFKIRTYDRTPPGRPDSCLYGPRAAAATAKMKWRLGYQRGRNINGTFGPQLYQLLTGKAQLTPLQQVRRASRQPYYQLKQVYPLAERARVCGWPGQGTHSFTQPPDNWQSDQALDLCAAEGTPVLAIRSGTVCVRAPARLHPGSGRFAGVSFYLCDDLGNTWFYQHNRAVAPGLAYGNQVLAGQTLAYVGVAGVAHLHLSCSQPPCRTSAFFQHAIGLPIPGPPPGITT